MVKSILYFFIFPICPPASGYLTELFFLNITFHKKTITELKIRLKRYFGSNINLQSHSIPIFLIQSGARLIFPVMKSKLPPTPIASFILPFFSELINFSWYGAPKLQNRIWHPEVLFMSFP